MAAGSQTGNKTGAGAASLWERLIAWAGALLVIGAAGYLGWYALEHEPLPPQIAIELISVAPSGSGFAATVRIRNDGNMTAEDLHIEGELRTDGRTVERSEASIPFVPSHSTRKGGLLFSRDPRNHQIVIRPTGYSEP